MSLYIFLKYHQKKKKSFIAKKPQALSTEKEKQNQTKDTAEVSLGGGT